MSFQRRSVKAFKFVLSCLLVWQGMALPAAAQIPTATQIPTESKLRIVTLEGEGVVHGIEQSLPRRLVVRVEGDDGRPVAGASVTFQLPDSGPSGLFPAGQTTLVTVTDEKGQARARGLRPNEVQGTFEIRVTARHQGRTASAVISQTNVIAVGSRVGAGRTGKGTGKWIVLLVIAGVAGGLGASLAGGGR